MSEPAPLGDLVETWKPPPGAEPLTEAEGAVVCQLCGYPRKQHSAPRGVRCPSRFGKGWGPGEFTPSGSSLPEAPEQHWQERADDWEERLP